MNLQSITIQEFKQFSERLFIDDLQPGLNLFVGPNEAGKSTIAEAVRTVFLERYKVSTLNDLLPWTRPNGQPVIEVSFSISGVPYVLKKHFVNRKRCELRVGHEVFTEDEAEDQLARLLGFSRAAKGLMKSEHAGIPGLLWVQQGQAQEVRDSTGHAAQYLREALTQLSGGTVSGGDDALIGAVQRELWQLLTERARKPTGALAAVENELSELRHQRTELDGQRQRFDEDIGHLSTQQAAFDDAQRKRLWDELEEKAVEAQKRAHAVAELERRLKELEQTVQLSNAELTLLLQQEQAASDLEASAAKQRRQLEEAKVAVGASETEYDVAATSVADTQRVQEGANRALELANAAVTAADMNSQIAQNKAEIERLRATIEKAEAASQAALEATRNAAACEVDSKKLRRLQAVSERIVPLQARKEAALTRIEYRLHGVITVDGSLVSGEGVLLLENEKTIGLPGLGEFSIVPGVSDISTLVAELDSLEGQRTQLQQAMGVSSVAEAENRHDNWKTLVAHQKMQSELVLLHAPDGIDALRTALAQALARLGAAQERLAGLPDVSNAVAVADAKRDADAAREKLEEARRTLTNAAERKSMTKATADSNLEALTLKEAQLKDPAFMQKREERHVKIVEARSHVNAQSKELESCRRDVDTAKTDDPAAEAKRFRESAALARADQQERQTRIARLRAQLEALGASGLGERLAKADASIEQLERRKGELFLRANALSLLEGLLVEERDAAVAQLRAPLTDRLGHYLKRLFPQSGLTVDDELGPVALHRGGRLDTLEALSYGTREQLGVLARLAYADLLKESGRPTLLLFDDAAVHTDAERREGIKRALLEAATRHQILVFTCHPELWNDLGVKQRRLEDLKAAA